MKTKQQSILLFLSTLFFFIIVSLPLPASDSTDKQSCDSTKIKACDVKNGKKNQEIKEEKDISELVLYYRGFPEEEKNLPEVPDDSICRITAVDGSAFRKIIENNNGKKTLIQIWAMWCHGRYKMMLDLVDFIPVNGEYNLILISSDINTQGQKEAIRKVLYSKGYRSNSYIIYNEIKSNSNEDVGAAIGPKNIFNFLEAFVEDFKQEELFFTAVLDENNEFIYKDILTGGKTDEEIKVAEKRKINKLKELLMK